jgi:hypothetical protein
MTKMLKIFLISYFLILFCGCKTKSKVILVLDLRKEVECENDNTHLYVDSVIYGEPKLKGEIVLVMREGQKIKLEMLNSKFDRIIVEGIIKGKQTESEDWGCIGANIIEVLNYRSYK